MAQTSCFTNYQESVVLAALPTLYVSLLTAAGDQASTGTEYSGDTYARQTVSWGSAALNANGDMMLTQNADITFPTPGVDWGAMPGYALNDGSTGGNQIANDIFNPQPFIASGTAFVIPAGTITCSVH